MRKIVLLAMSITMDMDPALLDSFTYIGIGVIAAGIIHFVFIWLKKRAEQTETKMDDLIVYSLGKPLVMLAFFIPLILAIQHSIYLYPRYQWIADSKILLSGYILVATWIIATFVDGF